MKLSAQKLKMSNKTHIRRDLDEVFDDVNKDTKEVLSRIENLEASEPKGSGYILIRNEQTLGTDGGTFSSGAWRTRTLNTEVADTENNASLSSNQITLAAGTYRVQASAPAYRVDNHQIRLQNITDGTTIALGTSEFSTSGAGESDQNRSWLSYYFTISSAKVLELQHQGTTSRNTDGFGRAASFDTEIYAIIEFFRL